MRASWKSDRLPIRVYCCASNEVASLKKILEYDPYLDGSLGKEDLEKVKADPEANIIFARQDYVLKDGVSLSLNPDQYYLYLKSEDAGFLDGGEKKLKAKISSFKRAAPEEEKKVIEVINRDRSNSEQGLGMIFG